MADNNSRNVVRNVSEREKDTHKKGRGILPKVISVLLAFVLWFYVVTVESPVNEKTFSSIPVDIQLSSASDLSVYSGYNVTVDVTVSGKRSELNQMSASDFTATADVSGYTEPGKYSVPVKIEIPDGATLVEKSISLLSVYLDVKATASVPVVVNLTGYILESGFELAGQNDIEKSVSEVSLTGPKSVLDTVKNASVTIYCGNGNISSSFKASGNIELMDANGVVVTNPYVTANIDQVEVKVPVYTTKELKLKVEFKHGYLDSSNSTVSIDPSSVTVRGDVDIIGDIEDYVISTIDEKSLTSEKLNIPISLPEGVTLTGDTENANVSITHKGTTTVTLNVSSIDVKNPGNLSYQLTSESVNVTLRGKVEDISEITADDIKLSVDLSNYSGSSGDVTVPITVKISDAFSKSVYELGEYNTVVSIK